jgi:hypothetical protein
MNAAKIAGLTAEQTKELVRRLEADRAQAVDVIVPGFTNSISSETKHAHDTKRVAA